LDLKLVKLSLTADHAPNDTLDSQYPVASALRLGRLLFDGLGECLPKGVHVNIAVPEEALGIPLAALLTESPPKLSDGYNLRAAGWLGNDFSFAMFVSARHFLGAFKSRVRDETSEAYLGVGNPKLSEARRITEKVTEANSQLKRRADSLLK